jgi:hypothetical protein
MKNTILECETLDEVKELLASDDWLIRLQAYRAFGFTKKNFDDNDPFLRLSAYRMLGFARKALTDPDKSIRKEAGRYFHVQKLKEKTNDECETLDEVKELKKELINTLEAYKNKLYFEIGELSLIKGFVDLDDSYAKQIKDYIFDEHESKWTAFIFDDNTYIAFHSNGDGVVTAPLYYDCDGDEVFLDKGLIDEKTISKINDIKNNPLRYINKRLSMLCEEQYEK